MEDNDYIKAWADESDGKEPAAHPVTEAVLAAKKVDESDFADAFQNDRFGLDIDKAKKKQDGEAEEVKAE